MKRVVFGFVVLLCVVGGGLTGLWLVLDYTRGSELEQWIGRQLVGVLQGYIVPELEFGRVDYRKPFTVVLDDVTLRAEEETLVGVRQLRLELAEVPRVGRPIQVRDIALTAATLRFIGRPDGTLVGWQPFVRPAVRKDPGSVPKGRRFSDVLVLRHVEIRDGEVELRGSDPARPAMTLAGINLTIESVPDAETPGWYTLAGAFERDPVFRVDLDARLNVDVGMLDVIALKLGAALGEETYGSLPAEIQDVLREHRVRGGLTAEAAGLIRLRDAAPADGTLVARLEDVHLVFGGTVCSAARCRLELATTGPDESSVAAGTLEVDEARLLELPLLSQLRGLLTKVTGAVKLPPRDRAAFEFRLERDHVAITKSEVVTAVMALRATGKVYYAGRLDLLVNAGVVEKVQAELGPVGAWFGKLSDRLVKYQVRGRLGAPEIRVRPLVGGG